MEQSGEADLVTSAAYLIRWAMPDSKIHKSKNNESKRNLEKF
jgi:hypothetical protein